MKTCTKCGAEKPATLEHFPPQKLGKDGLCAWCRVCLRKNHRRWYKKNRKRAIARVKRWRGKNRCRVRKRNRKLYRQDPLRHRLKQRRWRQRHPDKVLEHTRNRKARVRGAHGRHTKDDVARVLFDQKYRCYFCPTRLLRRYHVDHKTPISRGGSNWPRNLCCTCRTCNLRKGTKTVAEFIRWLREDVKK